MVSIQFISFLFSIAVLSYFAAMFLIDVGIAVFTPITKEGSYKSKMSLILDALWAIIGTSAVYLVVTLESVYATITYVAGIALLLPFLAFLIFLALHHGFLGYAEGFGFLGIKHLEEKYILAYSIPTVILAFIGITIFTSVLSGIGINASTLEPDYVKMFFNPFNIMFFIAIAAYTIYYVTLFFNMKDKLMIAGISLTVANALILAGLYAYVPYVFSKAITNPGFWIYLVVLYAMLYSLHKGFRFNNVISVILTAIGGIIMGMFMYPYVLNGAVNVYSLMTNPATLAAADIVITIIGLFVVGGLTAIAYKILYKSKQPQVTTSSHK